MAEKKGTSAGRLINCNLQHDVCHHFTIFSNGFDTNPVVIRRARMSIVDATAPTHCHPRCEQAVGF